MISLKLGLVALAVFNVADYFFTLWALERGFIEANPFMDAIINTPWFAVIKLGIIPCALLAVDSRGSPPALREKPDMDGAFDLRWSHDLSRQGGPAPHSLGGQQCYWSHGCRAARLP